MKVLLVNGSPNEKGCTYTGLMEVDDTLRKEGVDTELFYVGKQPISGCVACYTCRKTGAGRCVISDRVNECLEAAAGVDGFIFGTPVHFAAAGGSLTSFMDRLFFSAGKDIFYLKPAAAIVSARRGGTTSAFDQLNKYFTIREMPVISSTYWNMIHGSTPEEVKQDVEGLQTLRILARNMAWFLRCKAAGAQAGIAPPQREAPLRTNFIR
ncbi:MAG: flavodoxin family protein [Deltaproteobacteria bacterium]|nr:flavodoxin family protein [Deltaproteobacteria bacterium]